MSSTSRFLSPAAIAILAIAAVLALIGALIPSTAETQVTDSFDYLQDGHSPGAVLVTSKHTRGGFSLFGIDFSDPVNAVDVTFTVPGECETAIQSVSVWPPSNPSCAGPAEVAGPVGGSGRTADGDLIVSVSIEVSEECFTAVELGSDWPAPSESCDTPDS